MHKKSMHLLAPLWGNGLCRDLTVLFIISLIEFSMMSTSPVFLPWEIREGARVAVIKLVPFILAFLDEDGDKKTRIEREKERSRKRALASSMLQDLRGKNCTQRILSLY